MEPKSEERISWFPVPPETDLPENLRGLFSKARQRLGFVPNVFRVYSFRPERLSAWFSHYKQLHEPTENLNANVCGGELCLSGTRVPVTIVLDSVAEGSTREEDSTQLSVPPA